jgi:hypothetical protein
MKVKLIRITSTNNNLRTPTVEGEAVTFPVVGAHFSMLAASLDASKDVRMVTTSMITSVEVVDDKTYRFVTNNSVYELVVL